MPLFRENGKRHFTTKKDQSQNCLIYPENIMTGGLVRLN